jgi:tRNA(Ile)-lysidine synthetase-like protein
MPLSGGWCLDARRDSYVLRRGATERDAPVALPAQGELTWGDFHFRVTERSGTTLDAWGAAPTSWAAALPATARPIVRSWGAGDRLASAGGRPRRRVKRYLSEAGVRGSDRAGWPVVVAGQEEDVVWIPGVRRSDAATERSGGPVRHYVCERINR